MARQWIRSVRLTLGSGSKSLDLSELRIRFQVQQGDVQTPNIAQILVSNPGDQTVAMALKMEFTEVLLEAGYTEASGTIFKGEIFQPRYGRENPTDTYLSILARDFGKAYDYSVVSKALAAGATWRQQLDACLEPMKKFGVTVGHIDDLGSAKSPRGVSLFGMARDCIRDIALATGTSPSVQNGVFQMVKNSGYVPGDVIEVNSATGMIGMPTQTLDGIEVRTLLNPMMQPGRRIRINQADIQTAQFDPTVQGAPNNYLIPSIADDGIYKIYVVDHSGDTRGNPFYSDIICLRADGKDGFIPQALVSRGPSTDPQDH